MTVSKEEAMAAAQGIDDDVARYFRSLGFVVDWDCHRERWRGKWYEISDPRTKRLLVQIDVGATIDSLKKNLPRLVKGKPGIGDMDWEVRGDPKDLKHVVAVMQGKEAA